MYNPTCAVAVKSKRNNLHLVKDECRTEDCVNVNGKTMTRHELNEKLAYFYEHGGPIMEM
jgi:hypothetical protein